VPLAELATRVNLGEGMLTIAQAAQAKGCTYHALRMYLRTHPEVNKYCVGRQVFVRLVDLVGYVPRGM